MSVDRAGEKIVESILTRFALNMYFRIEEKGVLRHFEHQTTILTLKPLRNQFEFFLEKRLKRFLLNSHKK
jgi:hypothetical protein